MSLKIITNKSKIDSKYVDYNDLYFQSMSLRNDDLTSEILKRIDKAHYASELTFTGRDEMLGALNKSLLSTGCKTLLNIIYNPSICFSVAECGPNALETLSIIKDGIIYWERPVLFLTEDLSCDIEYDGNHYNCYMNFLDEVMK